MLSRKAPIGKEAKYVVVRTGSPRLYRQETWVTNKTKGSEEAGPPGEDTPVPRTEIANPQSKRPV